MNLRDYIRQNRGSGVAIAAALGIAPSYLSQMASGHRPISPATAVQINRLTDGQCALWDLRPDDWSEIWPDLARKQRAKSAA